MHIHSSNPVKYGQMHGQLLPHISAPKESGFGERTKNGQMAGETTCTFEPGLSIWDDWRL
jgi:hypothetical protein